MNGYSGPLNEKAEDAYYVLFQIEKQTLENIITKRILPGTRTLVMNGFHMQELQK